MPSQAMLLRALSVTLGAKDREPPTEFRIFRSGINESTKGPTLFDEEAAQAVMAEYEAHGIDLPIDWDHAMLHEETPVADRRAAGWFKLEVRDGELWAVDVRWTSEGEKALRAGEWRFFSPAFLRDNGTSRVFQLINIAICNLPATRQIQALVDAKQDVGATPRENPTPATAGKESNMTMISLAVVASTLGLAASATEAEVLSTGGRQRDEMRTILALTGAKTVAEASGVIAAWKESHAALDAVKAAEKARVEEEKRAKHAALLAKGRESGQITGATEAFWATQPLEALEGYLTAAGSVLPTPREQTTRQQHSTKSWDELTVPEKHRMINDDPAGAKALKAASRKGKA